MGWLTVTGVTGVVGVTPKFESGRLTVANVVDVCMKYGSKELYGTSNEPRAARVCVSADMRHDVLFLLEDRVWVERSQPLH